MSAEEMFVRNSKKNKILFFSDHAYEKMKKLMITSESVVKCIEEGFLVEQQDGYAGENPRMVFYNGHTNSFYVVIAIDIPHCIVITVCDMDLSKWDIVGDSIKRK